MRVLLLNFTRFGDLIQTQPVISGYKAQGHAVAVACLDNFQQAAELLADVDSIYPFRGGKLLARLDSGWPEALAEFEQWRTAVVEDFAPDAVINLTPSVGARTLTRTFAPARGVGLCLDEFGYGANTTLWASFLQTASANRGCSPFNITDLFRRVAELQGDDGKFQLVEPSGEAAKTARQLLDTGRSGKEKGFVGLQLGASEDRRRWPIERFVQLGRMLWEKNSLQPVLLGGPGEEVLGERFSQSADYPFINLIGRTSLPLLASVLTRLNLLVTNDTGTMHLAAGMGTPILGIFLCTAQPWDTGPYLPGSLCLEPNIDCHPCAFGMACPRREACRHVISAETVHTFVQRKLEEDQWGAASQDARCWLTTREADGMVGLEALPGQPDTDRWAWIAIQRQILRQFLDREGLEPQPAASGGNILLGIGMQAELMGTLDEAIGMCDVLEQQGVLLLRMPRENLKTKFLTFWQRLLALLSADSRLCVIGSLMLHESQDQGGDIAGFISLVSRYKELFQILRLRISS